MNHLFAPPMYGKAATHYDSGNCQSHYNLYTADSGAGRTMVAAVAAAEAAATAAAAAFAAANAAQEAAYAANAATGKANSYPTKASAVRSVNNKCGMQGYRPFPARRRKLRPDDSWRKMPHQERWHSFTCDGKRAQSHKRHMDGHGAERGLSPKSRSKQRPQQNIQPQQQRQVKRNNYNGGYVASESCKHRTKAKDGQPRSIVHARVSGGDASRAQHSSGKRNRKVSAEVLELFKEAVNVSTQTFSDDAKGSQTESFHDDAVTFSLSTCDSDDDEAEFFPSTDLAHDSHKQATE